MTHPSSLDERWRAGFAESAPEFDADAIDALARRDRRVVRRRRNRRALAASVGAASLAVVIGVAALVASGRSSHPSIATEVPTTRPEVTTPAPVTLPGHVAVDVAPGGEMRLALPGRSVVDPTAPLIHLEPGTTTFDLQSHVADAISLVRDRGSASPTTPTAVTPDHPAAIAAQLTEGRYFLYSTVPGHRAAGEQATIIVGKPGNQFGDITKEPIAFGAPPVAGERTLVATLDDTGLHFSPEKFPGGSVNLELVDKRSNRAPGDDVVLTFYVSGPRIPMIAVRAGDIGSGSLCYGAVSSALLNNGVSMNVQWAPFEIEASKDCTTPVT